MTTIRFHGDIHGRINPWSKEAAEAVESVQIGDFGFGFFSEEYENRINNFFHAHPQVKFIRGNHDDPARCRMSPGYIEDGTFDEFNSIYYIGGAWSIDHAYRTPGKSWWPDEEVDDMTFDRLFKEVVEKKPKIMVTHDGPSQATLPMFIEKGDSLFSGGLYPNRTNEWLSRIFEHHQPEVWLFGHWHKTKIHKVENTVFTCIGEEDYIDLDTTTYGIKKRNHD